MKALPSEGAPEESEADSARRLNMSLSHSRSTPRNRARRGGSERRLQTASARGRSLGDMFGCHRLAERMANGRRRLDRLCHTVLQVDRAEKVPQPFEGDLSDKDIATRANPPPKKINRCRLNKCQQEAA